MLREVAEHCVDLVATDHGVQLGWSLQSLSALDGVLQTLAADGPLHADRLDLWWKLVGAYTGEVLITADGGQ